MRQKLPMLDGIQIAKPCPANWDEMKGDDVVRHCSLCRLNVYNVSEMSREDALQLIHEAEGRLCIRMYRREDGTVLTKDCPKGLANFRRRVVKRVALAASLALTAAGCGRLGERLRNDFGFGGNTTMGEMPMTGKVAVPSASKPSVKVNK